jgi:hypothetical protein
MPRSSGTYSFPVGTPVVTGTSISSSDFNRLASDIGTEITNSVPRDGTAPPTANLPMGGFKHTNVANATSRTDYCATGQAQDNTFDWLTSVSGTDTITASLTPTLASYTAGQTFRFVAAGANTTTTVTININALGAKSITKNGSTALAIGDIINGSLLEIVYDGTRFQLIGVLPPFSDANPLVKNSADATKLVKFDASGITTATTRTITVPDASFTLPQDSLVVHLAGTETITGTKTFSSMPILPTQSMVRVNTANGYGSTNTKIRRFTNFTNGVNGAIIQGTDITFSDNATLGASFTINTSGVYAMSCTNSASVIMTTGISLNTSQPTVVISSLSASEIVVLSAISNTASGSVSNTMYLSAGSVIRMHEDGTASIGLCAFTITRVS